MAEGREMTLKEWVERLPEFHRARQEYDTMLKGLKEVASGQCGDICADFNDVPHYVRVARDALPKEPTTQDTTQ